MLPTVVFALVILSSIILFGSRRAAAVCLLAGVLFITQGQQVSLFGVSFHYFRFLEIVGMIRIVRNWELRSLKFNNVDTWLLRLYSLLAIVSIIRSDDNSIYYIGRSIDAVFCYLIFRCLIQGLLDWVYVLRAASFMLVMYAGLVAVEGLTGRNPWSVMGGVYEGYYFRNDKPRCMGSFQHPILMGTLGSSLIPVYIALLLTRTDMLMALIAIPACLSLIYFANSGGPVSALAAGLVGWALWPFRARMKVIRLGLLMLVIILAIFMKAPIWYLPSKVSSITGGGGWHRSYLLECAFNDIQKWWLIGMPLKDTADWFPYSIDDFGGADITNQYLAFGLAGGLASMLIFIYISVLVFSSIGNSLRNFDGKNLPINLYSSLIWSMGVLLVVHIVSWFGVSYYDKSFILMLMQIAVISSLASDKRIASPEKSQQVPSTLIYMDVHS